MPVADPLVMPLAIEMLECYEQELLKLEDPPASIGIRPGTTVDFLLSTTDDECCGGLGWVRPVGFYPSSTVALTPDETPQKQGTTAWAVVLEMGIVTCAPTHDEHSIPSNEEWLTTAQMVMDASAAMRRAICCFIDADRINRIQRVLPGTWEPVAVQGGCVGGVLTVTLRGPACDCIDAGPSSS